MRTQGKVIAAGPANAGKTCLIERYIRNVFAAEEGGHGPTLSFDCFQKKLFIDDTEVQLFIYDTAGQERFADMGGAYYRGADVCLLCFDMSNLASFDNAKWWMKKVMEYNDRCSFILVGTKEDLVYKVKADGVEDDAPPPDLSFITNWSDQEGIPFFSTSAKTTHSNGISFLFHTVAEKCIRQQREKQLRDMNPAGNNNNVALRSTIGSPQASCCQ